MILFAFEQVCQRLTTLQRETKRLFAPDIQELRA